MYVIKVKIPILLFCYLVFKSQALEKFSLKEENIILATESTLRNITNKLFAGLHFATFSSKSKQSLLVHKYFTSVTLKDHNTLNLIVKLSRADKNNVRNETEHFISIINDILNEDNSVDINSIAHNEDIIEYIDEFLSKMEGFKENSSVNNDYQNFEIKDEIITILLSDNALKYNLSQENTVKPEDDVNAVSESEFWMPEPERRIYHGDRTKIKYFPFMASIHIFDAFQCAGSIIKSDLILTAASCLQLAWNNRFFRENPSFLSTRVGSNFYNGGGESIPILEVYFHPSYNPKSLRNNIAVLRLVRHLKFKRTKRRLKKIDIDREDSSLSMATDGITIVGWGAKGTSNVVRDPWSNQLAYAVLDVYHLQECQKIYSREYVTRTNFCAGFISKGGGACNHDVGGPGVVNGILTGVVSFGSPVCGSRDSPTVFTKVGFYADWIEEIMEQEVPHTKKRTTLRIETIQTPKPPYLTHTTSKMLPIDDDTMRPMQPNEYDTLRILEEEKLFDEFLSTMFNSKEVKEYKDLINEIAIDKPKDVNAFDLNSTPEKKDTQEIERTIAKVLEKDDEDQEVGSKNVVLYTKMDDIKSEKGKHRYTVYDKYSKETGGDSDEAIEKNIADLSYSSETDNKYYSSSSEEDKGLAVATINEDTTERDAKKKIDQIEDDKVITLFYLSDKEKNNTSVEKTEKVIEDFEDNLNEGLSIENELTDFGLRTNKTSGSILELLSGNDLYNLLSEAIEELTKNKTKSL